MLDQCHNIEDKIPGQIRSVLNVQEMTARALLVDREALAAAQAAGDVLGANGVAHGRLLHRRPRRPRGLARVARPARPTRWRAYAASGYQAQIEAEPRRRHPGRLGRVASRTGQRASAWSDKPVDADALSTK